MLNRSSTYPLRPVNTNNTRPSRITATAGTRLVGAYSLSNVIIFLSIRVLRPESLQKHHPQDRLDQAYAHCPKFPIADPRGSLDLCFYSNVAERSHKPAKDHRLGGLYPFVNCISRYGLQQPTCYRSYNKHDNTTYITHLTLCITTTSHTRNQIPQQGLLAPTI